MVPRPDGFEGMFFVRQEIQLSLTNMVGWTGVIGVRFQFFLGKAQTQTMVGTK